MKKVVKLIAGLALVAALAAIPAAGSLLATDQPPLGATQVATDQPPLSSATTV